MTGMIIRITTTFGIPGFPPGRPDHVTGRLRTWLRMHGAPDAVVATDGERVEIGMTVAASTFNEANVKVGRLLLHALASIRVTAAPAMRIDAIRTVGELNDMQDKVMRDVTRTISRVDA